MQTNTSAFKSLSLNQYAEIIRKQQQDEHKGKENTFEKLIVKIKAQHKN